MSNIIKESRLQLHSPNAAELGRYGKAPVDYFTGVPSIVVPLTSVHAKGYELPVELRYHAEATGRSSIRDGSASAGPCMREAASTGSSTA